METALRDEATELLADLIRIDTTNPPGRETAAATFLKEFLEREGIACELVAREPDRANLIARIPGTGDGPSLALLGHTDVVYADGRDWMHPPFAGVVEDGWVWGRGALDMKHHTVANVLAFALLARSGFRPRGDLVLVAEADEEDGTAEVGLGWLVEVRPDLRTDFALTEGGGDRLVLADGRVVYTLGVAEKTLVPVRVTARGVAGHASVPEAGENALLRLAPAIERLARHRPPRSLEPELAALLDVVVPEPLPLEQRIERARAAHPVLAECIPAMRSLTIAPTMIEASRKRNVIPALAELVCDCRALPGADPEVVLGELRAVLDGAPLTVTLEADAGGGTRSPIDTQLRDACASFLAELEPGAELVPVMCTGFTNSHFLREAFGTVAYGFLPLRHTEAELASEVVHGADERIRQDDLPIAVRFLEHAARTIGGSP